MAGLRWVSLVWVRAAGACALLGAVLSTALAPLPAAAQGQAPSGQPGTDGALTPPPVVDPKKVETTPVAPAARTFAPQEITLSPVPVLMLAGSATWEEAFEKLVASVKQADAELKRLGLARAGDTFIVYNSADDLSFEYEIQVPFSGTTKQKPANGMKLGGSHAGKVLKFTHAGSFADMDNTYEQIANYLDEKNVEQNDMYIEQYRTDIVSGSPEALEIDILVPVP
ncbi:GyrI-like domain-containing protein [Xanthobacter autotrophicus]|uniref:GyrI-like domain-containing protein n=1 Tax=Xanthobacter TaxID=279 RepID=UPI0024ABE137|nr:GyrI-like domain-containing protein [Xanthobacter autotrophicus]MDI4663393.1 GyrI-like domain-containing protein [Xanthobacter autotrophicus]